MNIVYIFIWICIMACLKYDLKQSSIKSCLRATLFTLLAYVFIEMDNIEGLSLIVDDQSDNAIIKKFNKYKKKKRRCKYLRNQTALSLSNFNTEMNKLGDVTQLTDASFNADTMADIADMYRGQFGVVQSSFDDLNAIKQLDGICN